MNRFNQITVRLFPAYTIILLSVWLTGCAFIPDNFQFSEEIVDYAAMRQVNVKRVALLDVPTPTGIWLGDPGSGGALLFGPLVGLGAATHSGGEVTSVNFFSETTQQEVKIWLEEYGIEVILLKAERVKKSKMLKKYDQFKEIDADAILEIAPIRVGFIWNIGKTFSRKSLSPDVALTYRLITPGDNQILIESNVFYSSFPDQYADWTGSKLTGPKDHLFKDSDSVKEQPEEAVRRLKLAISGASELISKNVSMNVRLFAD
jgi:hypothetical protein